MFSRRILEKLLSCDNEELPNLHSHSLLVSSVTDNVSRCIRKILVTTADYDECKLKEKIRKSTTEFIRTITKTASPYDVLLPSSRSDILLKHLYLNNGNVQVKSSKYHYNKKATSVIFKELKNYRSEYLNIRRDENERSVRIFDLNFAVALINLHSDASKQVLDSMVEKCIEDFDENNEKILEFLKMIWESKTMVISPNLYDMLTLKLIYLVEIRFFDMVTVLMREHREFCSIDKFKEIFVSRFPNYYMLLNRLSNSSAIFYTFFKILTDLFIKSNFEKIIEELIKYLLDEVKSIYKNGDLLDLHPSRLNNTISLLHNNVDVMKKDENVYKYILFTIFQLHEKSKIDFTFLMIQYPEWLNCYVNDYN